MTDVLRIAHPQNCPPYGNSRVGICEGNRYLKKDTQAVMIHKDQIVQAPFNSLLSATGQPR